jgi:hypothetical protein
MALNRIAVKIRTMKIMAMTMLDMASTNPGQ